jgi:hypothetical protein
VLLRRWGCSMSAQPSAVACTDALHRELGQWSSILAQLSGDDDVAPTNGTRPYAVTVIELIRTVVRRCGYDVVRFKTPFGVSARPVGITDSQ